MEPNNSALFGERLLDVELDNLVHQILQGVRRQGASLVVVTHDAALAARMDRQLRLVDGVLQAP